MLENFIPYSTQNIDESDEVAILKALKSSHLTQGRFTREFERAISEFIGIREAVSFNSATSALYTAFYMLKELCLIGEQNLDSVKLESSEGFMSDFKHRDSKLDAKKDFKKYFEIECKEDSQKKNIEDSNNYLQNLLSSPNFIYAKKHKTISVITTPITFVATTNMMLQNAITPIFVDIDISGNLNIDKIESALRDDTIAVCSVDYAGNSVDMARLKNIAKKYNLLWISDSSHSFGGEFKGEFSGEKRWQKVGSQADMSIFSFHALKPITTCEGGTLVSNHPLFTHIASLISSHGIIKKSFYNHDCEALGFNFRLNEISAALGLSQLKRIESFIRKREEIARFYDEYFKGNVYFYTPKIFASEAKGCGLKTPNGELRNLKNNQSNKKTESIPHLKDSHNQSIIKSTRHLYPILLDPRYHCKKDAIMHDLLAKNVGVQVHYKPIYNFSLYKKFNYPILRNAEDFYHAEISIPCHQNMNLDIAKKVADAVLGCFREIKY